MSPIKIDTTAIPKIEVKILCSAFLEDIKRFYEVPENNAAFEKWMAEREVAQA